MINQDGNRYHIYPSGPDGHEEVRFDLWDTAHDVRIFTTPDTGPKGLLEIMHIAALLEASPTPEFKGECLNDIEMPRRYIALWSSNELSTAS